VLRERLDVVERDEVLEREPSPQAPADEPVELVRGQASVGRRFDRQIVRGQNMALLELACRVSPNGNG